eukprot:COSAG03_NODE_20890_length_312_cov_0.723005_1_plen_39_part_01
MVGFRRLTEVSAAGSCGGRFANEGWREAEAECRDHSARE